MGKGWERGKISRDERGGVRVQHLSPVNEKKAMGTEHGIWSHAALCLVSAILPVFSFIAVFFFGRVGGERSETRGMRQRCQKGGGRLRRNVNEAIGLQTAGRMGNGGEEGGLAGRVRKVNILPSLVPLFYRGLMGFV